MKYLRFCIFLLILSTIVHPNEELQSFHLLDNINFTLEAGFPRYYTTYCYNAINCTNIITFYPNRNPDASAIIEVGTRVSNYNISLNTSYIVYDSNVELMPFMPFLPLGLSSYQIIKMFVINLTSETSSMGVWDAMDHVYRRCEVASGGIPPSSGPECNLKLQCFAYKNCIESNIGRRVSDQSYQLIVQIGGIYSFVMTYIMIIPYVIGLLFSVLNLVLFVQLKSLKNPFMIFVAIQSFYCIFWFLCFLPSTLATSTFEGVSLLGLRFTSLLIGSKSISVDFFTIALSLGYLCSFGIEAIRFFKALSRVFALRFPLWSSDKLTIKHALFSCLSTFILGIIAWVFVVLNKTITYSPDGFNLGTVISICEGRDPIVLRQGIFLYIAFGWDCFPQYILFDELFPLNLITLVLDCYVFFLLKCQLSKLNDQQKKRENVLKLFIVLDLIEVFYSCFRRMLLFIYPHNFVSGYLNFSSQWSMFYYNAYARHIILDLYEIDRHFFYVIRLLFYMVEMVVCQVLMRRIQIVENPHDVPRNFVDQFLLKLTKKFYTRVLRVQPTIINNQPTTIINNPASLVVARS